MSVHGTSIGVELDVAGPAPGPLERPQHHVGELQRSRAPPCGASSRASSTRSPTSVDSSATCACTSSRISARSASGRVGAPGRLAEASSSRLVRIEVSGVRSSCPASATSRRCCSCDAASAPSISLKLAREPGQLVGAVHRDRAQVPGGGDALGRRGQPVDRAQPGPGDRHARRARRPPPRSRRRSAARTRAWSAPAGWRRAAGRSPAPAPDRPARPPPGTARPPRWRCATDESDSPAGHLQLVARPAAARTPHPRRSCAGPFASSSASRMSPAPSTSVGMRGQLTAGRPARSARRRSRAAAGWRRGSCRMFDAHGEERRRRDQHHRQRRDQRGQHPDPGAQRDLVQRLAAGAAEPSGAAVPRRRGRPGHGGVSRRTYPTPRTVWISRGSPSASVLRRR